MNKELLLNWILEDAEKNEGVYEDLRRIDGNQIDLPSSLSSTSNKMISRLRSHFKDDVTLISRVLNHHFPDQYLFYRVSRLEEEIFTGFEFFSSIVPEFDFPFSRVGRKGFDRYLAVNEALITCFKRGYPDLGNPQSRIAWFLYEGLGQLFLEKSEYHRYWVMATREENFAELDRNDDLNWSGRKGMQAGDLIFVYRTAPSSAITDVFEATEDSYFDPWGEWDGFWVDMSRVCRIEGVPFADLKNDPVLGKWGAVRKRFQGIVVESVPHSIYNGLLERMPEDLRTRHGLKPELTASEGRSGQFAIEADFEDQIIEPLLKRWGLNYQRQYRCRFPFGRQYYSGVVDFHVSDGRGPITLFENKLKILHDKGEEDLQQAMEQGKSYALMLGLPSFVVASPEGLWIYSLQRNTETLEKHIPLEELDAREEDARRLLLKLRAE